MLSLCHHGVDDYTIEDPFQARKKPHLDHVWPKLAVAGRLCPSSKGESDNKARNRGRNDKITALIELDGKTEK
jgi:hypothetical protein